MTNAGGGPTQPQPPQPPQPRQTIRITTLPRAQTRPYDPARARERMRGVLALLLIGLLGGTIAAAFALVAAHKLTVGDMHQLLDSILSAEVALTGAAIGFYFGGRSQV